MPDTSGPFDGPSPWAEAEWYRHMPAAMPSGVIGTGAASATTGALAFGSSGLAITLAAGLANVGGAGYSRSAPLAAISTAANANSTLARRDRIVLRRSLSTHTVTLVIIQGTPSATPVEPATTNDATTFDLPLFSFLVPAANGTSISGVVDERRWIDPDTGTRAVVEVGISTTAQLVPPSGATLKGWTFSPTGVFTYNGSTGVFTVSHRGLWNFDGSLTSDDTVVGRSVVALSLPDHPTGITSTSDSRNRATGYNGAGILTQSLSAGPTFMEAGHRFSVTVSQTATDGGTIPYSASFRVALLG